MIVAAPEQCEDESMTIPLPEYDFANPPADENRRPNLMQIETTTLCNASCWMCPREKATRSNHKNRMDADVFKATVTQFEEMGGKIVLPFIDGEPLMDTRMCDFVEWIADNTALKIGWYTNGELLNEEKATRLLSTRRIPCFNVSMQGGNKETLERNMGTSWDKTIENVERLIAINRSLGSPSQIRANMCVGGPSIDSVEDFKARWSNFPDVLICLGAYSNFGGLGKDEVGDAPWRGVERNVCDRGTRHIYVFWDGEVGQCCFDLIGSIKYGNMRVGNSVPERRLYDIWNSDKARASRKAHWELRVKDMPPICHACTAPRFRG